MLMFPFNAKVPREKGLAFMEPRHIRLRVPLSLLVVGVLVAGCATLKFVKDRLEPPHPVPGGILFQLDSPGSRSVYVAGEFNGWEYQPGQRRAITLKQDENGIWKAVVPLSSGRYQYKFVLDSTAWVLDPNNPYTYDDGRGNINSLVIVR